MIDTRNAGLAAASKRLRKTATITHVGATGVFTVGAGFLDTLQPGDVIRLSGLTGGSGFDELLDYYLVAPSWDTGATTFKLSLFPGGPAIATGTDITAGNASSGNLTATDSGVLAGNYISGDSPRGR